MRRRALWAVPLAVLTICSSRPLQAEDEKPEDRKAWQAAERKKLAGRWTTVREVITDPDKAPVRRRVDLEFEAGELTVHIFDEKDRQIHTGSLKVVGVEKIGKRHFFPYRLELDRGEAYYDLVGERLVVVGRIVPRPWEGFPLSGEYRRGARPK